MEAKVQHDIPNTLQAVLDKLYEAIRNITTLAILASKCDFENYDLNLLQDFWSLHLTCVDDARVQCEYLVDFIKGNQKW